MLGMVLFSLRLAFRSCNRSPPVSVIVHLRMRSGTKFKEGAQPSEEISLRRYQAAARLLLEKSKSYWSLAEPPHQVPCSCYRPQRSQSTFPRLSNLLARPFTLPPQRLFRPGA